MNRPRPATFTTDTPAATINNFLQGLSWFTPSDFRIYEKVISFTHRGNKEHGISRARSEDKRSCEACDPLTALKDLTTTGTLLFCTANIKPAFRTKAEAEQNELSASDLWHSYIVLYKDREIVIYDPDYVPHESGTRRLTQMKKLALVRSLVRVMTAPSSEEVWKVKSKAGNYRGYRGWGKRIDRIRIGGGGNPGTRSKQMSGRWVEKFVKNGCRWSFERWEELKL